jgi:energy-coupling factor transport system substrate-specific component
MFSGAQISLYPMAGNFVGIILGALTALDPYRDRLRIETDDLSTLLVGPPEVLFPAMREWWRHGPPRPVREATEI